MNDPDVSVKLKNELDNCLKKLKSEAAAILGLSALTKSNQTTYAIEAPLKNMARKLLSDKIPPSAEIMNIIEELTLEGDKLIEILNQEKDDLQQQIMAADSQLKSTRQFLEDQAVEREAERDEYTRELSMLQQHIKQTRVDPKYHLHLTSQLRKLEKEHKSSITACQPVEDLENQVKDTTNNLTDVEMKKKEIENELKATVEKVWVLTDIINKLENQLLVKSEREECLEKRLDELEVELEHQCNAQQAMVQEMESLKSREESEGNYMEQIQALQEEMKSQYSSNSIRNIKTQLREIEEGIETRTRELESLNLNSSTNSLSSPSEEISIREHLEMYRCDSPELCPSPVALPVDEVNKLQDKIQRHIRSQDMIIKKLKDQQLRINKLTHLLGEVQAERDALQSTVDKLNADLNKAHNKVDDLRHQADIARESVNQELNEKLTTLEQKCKQLKQDLEQTQTLLQQKEEQIKRAKELIDNQNDKLRNLSQASPEIVQALQMELASVMSEKNQLQELVHKYKSELEAVDMSPLYNCLLNDKNEDILELQKTVNLLQQNQSDNQDGRNIVDSGGGDSYGPSVISKTVSFAEELSPIARNASHVRDIPHSLNSLPSFPNFNQIYTIEKPNSLPNCSEIQHIRESSISLNQSPINISSPSSRNDTSIGQEKISKLENEVKSLRSLVTDLSDAKRNVETYISSFTDDRKYYESQLDKLLDEKKSQEEEIDKLRETLEKKDTEIKNTLADVNKLQIILSNLQEKLKQASKLASKDNELKKELSEMKEKCSHLEESLEQFYKFREELGSINEDFKYNESNNYFQNILETLRQKLRQTTEIELANSNLKRQLEKIKKERDRIQNENHQLTACKNQFENELLTLKCEVDEINQNNSKLKSDISNYIQVKQDNVELLNRIEQMELSKNLVDVELSGLRSQNNKLIEELECLKTELKFKKVNNNYSEELIEKDVEPSSLQHENEHVADLEDLTYEIEKQLDLSAQLDNSLLHTLEDKSTTKSAKKMITPPTSLLPLTPPGSRESLRSADNGNRLDKNNVDQSVSGRDEGLIHMITNEMTGWQAADIKQNQLTSQVNNLSRLVQTQDNRITRLLVELDSKKKECLVMELELLKERSNLKQAQCLLETERARARNIQKEDTHLIETLRVRLESALKSESNLKSSLMAEKQKVETLEACLNSARAFETYIQSSSDSESSHGLRQELILRMELERLKQTNNDLEVVISRERNYQSSLKEKLNLLQAQLQTTEKQSEELQNKLKSECKLRESAENELKNLITNTYDTGGKTNENQFTSRQTMQSLLQQNKEWKDECMQLRECIRLQREHEDYWSVNVQTPLIKQLSDVNRSLEILVREKLTLQTYVNCIEKERDFLKARVDKLEQLNEKLSDNQFSISSQLSTKLNLQSVLNKLQYLAEMNHKMESHRKALIWQKRYLLVAINGYQKTTQSVINRIDPYHSPKKTRVSFRSVVHVILACIKLNYIHKRRKACRKILINKMKAEIQLTTSSNHQHPPTSPTMSTNCLKKNNVDVLNTSAVNCMSLSPPSRDLYAIPRTRSVSSEIGSEPTKLSQYVVMFDQMQKRLGKIIQNDNL